MANINELRNVINKLKAEEVKSFSELDQVFASIVSDESKDFNESLNLLESFFCGELQKKLEKSI